MCLHFFPKQVISSRTEVDVLRHPLSPSQPRKAQATPNQSSSVRTRWIKKKRFVTISLCGRGGSPHRIKGTTKNRHPGPSHPVRPALLVRLRSTAGWYRTGKRITGPSYPVRSSPVRLSSWSPSDDFSSSPEQPTTPEQQSSQKQQRKQQLVSPFYFILRRGRPLENPRNLSVT